jgi:hypothetical protein
MPFERMWIITKKTDYNQERIDVKLGAEKKPFEKRVILTKKRQDTFKRR